MLLECRKPRPWVTTRLAVVSLSPALGLGETTRKPSALQRPSSYPRGLSRKGSAFWRCGSQLLAGHLNFPGPPQGTDRFLWCPKYYFAQKAHKVVASPSHASPPRYREGERSAIVARRHVSYFFLAAVDLPLLLRRQGKHSFSVLVSEVKFILTRGKTNHVSTQHGDHTDTTPQASDADQWPSQRIAPCPAPIDLPGQFSNYHPVIADLSMTPGWQQAAGRKQL